jgi:hypothetical protein
MNGNNDKRLGLQVTLPTGKFCGKNLESKKLKFVIHSLIDERKEKEYNSESDYNTVEF